MRWFARPRPARGSAPILAVEKLDVYYGRAHALQEVSLRLEHGVTAVVGRNGMGKTTLCNAITGLVRASGSVRLAGEEILGLPPNAITSRGVGYVPQGRRVWPSLTVDEHLRLASRDRAGAWTVARVYQTFPRLAERKGNGGAELSGGEQQMLAIARALLFNPILLVMDEPTEGLAPVIVRAGGRDAEAPRRRRRDLGAADRAEPRRGHRRRRHRRRHGQRPHRPLDALGRAGRRPGPPAAPARRQGGRGRGGGRRGPARSRIRARRTDSVTVYTVRRSTDDVEPATPRRARAGRRAHGARLHPVERGRSPERAARPAGRAARRSGRRRPVARRGGRRRGRERPRRAGGGAAGGRHHRARGLRRRHLRHQGARAVLPPQLPGEARGAHRHGRPGDVRQAVAGHDPSARGGAAPSAGRARRVHGRPRLGGQRDGGGLRAVRRCAGATWAASSRRAAPAAPRWPRGPCAGCPSACPRSWCPRWRPAT